MIRREVLAATKKAAAKKRQGVVDPSWSATHEHSASSQQEFDVLVFKNAVYFTSVLVKGAGVRERRQFDTFPEAVADALSRDAPTGRHCMVWAVAQSGRHTSLDRAAWPTWAVVWNEMKRRPRACVSGAACIAKSAGSVKVCRRGGCWSEENRKEHEIIRQLAERAGLARRS